MKYVVHTKHLNLAANMHFKLEIM